jgi:hypothetical protein
LHTFSTYDVLKAFSRLIDFLRIFGWCRLGGFFLQRR